MRYLDVYAAIRRGVRYAPDLAVELYQPQVAVERAADVLRKVGLLRFVRHGRRTRLEVADDVPDEASAVQRATAAGLNLRAIIPGARVSIYPVRR